MNDLQNKHTVIWQFVKKWLMPNPGTIIVVMLLLFTVPSLAQQGSNGVNSISISTIPYQGRLASADGMPVTGMQNMAFSLYETPTGGTPLWQEYWIGGSSVAVSDGLFSIMLGSLNTDLTNIVQSHNNLYLGVTVGTDPEMSPRVQLGSVPFSIWALSVADGSISEAKIADLAVTAAKLAENAVINSKIAAGAVSGEKLAANAVTTDKIADGTVGNSDLANDAVTANKIADGAVGNNDLAANAVMANNIVTNSVSSSHIIDGSIATADMADGSVTQDKAPFAAESFWLEGATISQPNNIKVLGGTHIFTVSTAAPVKTVYIDITALGLQQRPNAICQLVNVETNVEYCHADWDGSTAATLRVDLRRYNGANLTIGPRRINIILFGQ